VVSHPVRPQSNHGHLTVLQYYNMHADITRIGYTDEGFYRSDDPTNSVKALKEGG